MQSAIGERYFKVIAIQLPIVNVGKGNFATRCLSCERFGLFLKF